MSATVRLIRERRPFRDRLRRYQVLVDNQKVGDLAWGEQKGFPVEPGSHTVRIKVDWAGSNELTVTAPDGEAVELRCGPGGSTFFGMWTVFYAPQRYIELRRSPAE